jgi:predicted nucleic acid-binding protein
MSTFLDTNILCRLAKADDPQHEMAKRAVQEAIKRDGGDRPVFNAQVEREFLSVATRKAEANGLGMPPKDAVEMLDSFRSFCEFRNDPPSVHQRTKELVVTLSISGKQVHDAAIAASAEAHGGKLLTINQEHFQRFHEKGIVALLDPQELAKARVQEQTQQAQHEQRPEPGPTPGHHQDRDHGHER